MLRNGDKASKGDDGRAVVAGCQGLNLCGDVASQVMKYDNAFANTARSAASVFSGMAKDNKAFKYASKAIKWGCDNVNPLICIAGGIKTLKSDDKISTGITEAAALTTMFAGENFIKSNYEAISKSKVVKNLIKQMKNTKGIKNIFKYISKKNLGGKIGTVIKGLALVSASIASYSAGEYMGKNIAGSVKSKLEFKA